VDSFHDRQQGQPGPQDQGHTVMFKVRSRPRPGPPKPRPYLSKAKPIHCTHYSSNSKPKQNGKEYCTKAVKHLIHITTLHVNPRRLGLIIRPRTLKAWTQKPRPGGLKARPRPRTNIPGDRCPSRHSPTVSQHSSELRHRLQCEVITNWNHPFLITK